MPAAEGNKDAVPGDVLAYACAGSGTGTGTGTGSSRSDETSTDEDLPTFTFRPCNLGPALVGRHHFKYLGLEHEIPSDRDGDPKAARESDSSMGAYFSSRSAAAKGGT